MNLFKRTASEPAGAVKEAAPGVELRHLTDKDFDELVGDPNVPAVVDFWAEWCGPCHMISPSVQQLANEFAGRLTVAKLNADDYPEVLGRYGIMGIPTVIFFKGGEEVDRIIGVQGYNTLKSKAERMLA